MTVVAALSFVGGLGALLAGATRAAFWLFVLGTSCALVCFLLPRRDL